jgi:hypothetical protein
MTAMAEAYLHRQKMSRMFGNRPTNTDNLESMQLELLRAEIDNIKNSNAGDAELSRQSGQMAQNYLKQWNTGLEKAGGLYNAAIGEITKASDMVGGAYKDVSESLGSMSQDIKNEYESMKSQWAGTKGQLQESASQDIGNRQQLTRQFMDLTRGDEEGAAGRAMADVGAQSEAGRQAEAMRLQGLGIDPTSGRARSLMRTSRSQEALGKVMAGNQARLAEKDRIAGLTATGLNLIDPTKSVNAATSIQNLENQMLASRSNLEVNRANIQGNLAGTTANLASQHGNLASGYAQNVVAPKGEMGAAQLGVSQATKPGPNTSAGSGSVKGRPQTFADVQARGAAWKKQYYG